MSEPLAANAPVYVCTNKTNFCGIRAAQRGTNVHDVAKAQPRQLGCAAPSRLTP
ncbi:MAG: hypothetical protein JWN48_506 [Myxococcaceae bacterium]|nr:hypothetical protein [Myxococcaceae bacterium]